MDEFDSIINLEQTFYDDGYKDGYEHGRIHGLIEGRALGREKGFEMWEELGYYEGFASTWKAMIYLGGIEPPALAPAESRALHHIKTLLEMISQFPLTNPSPIESSETGQELDILKLLRQIRSKYKILCSSLGVRPRIYAADGSLIQDSEDGSTPGGTQGKKKNSIWDLEGGDGEKPKQTQQQFLSF